MNVNDQSPISDPLITITLPFSAWQLVTGYIEASVVRVLSEIVRQANSQIAAATAPASTTEAQKDECAPGAEDRAH